jgi:hypothetical protein
MPWRAGSSDVTATPRSAGHDGTSPPADVRPAKRAAEQVLARHSLTVTLPGNIGTLHLPEPDRLAFYGGIGALAAFGILDWPVAVVLGVGHALADDHHHQCLAEFGEALADA